MHNNNFNAEPNQVVDTDVDNIELHTSHDMETLLQRQPKLNFQSSHKFFDMNVEQDRMQRWMQDQETRLKVSSISHMPCKSTIFYKKYLLDFMINCIPRTNVHGGYYGLVIVTRLRRVCRVCRVRRHFIVLTIT